MSIADVDAYIAALPPRSREVVERLRQTIRAELPADAGERISYGIPTFTVGGKWVVYLAGYEGHVSVHPVHLAGDEMDAELAPYLSGKGTMRMPLDAPIPYELVARVARSLLVRRVG